VIFPIATHFERGHPAELLEILALLALELLAQLLALQALRLGLA